MWLTLCLTKVLISHLPASIERSVDAPTRSFQGFDSRVVLWGKMMLYLTLESFSILNKELNDGCGDAVIKAVFVKGPSDRGK